MFFMVGGAAAQIRPGLRPLNYEYAPGVGNYLQMKAGLEITREFVGELPVIEASGDAHYPMRRLCLARKMRREATFCR
jgi:hypothetical protein